MNAVEMKDSGVEWLGEIPAHWDVKRLKHTATVRTSNVDKKSVDTERGVSLLNYTDVYYNEYITDDIEFMRATATTQQIQLFELRADDVIVTKDSESWDDIAVPSCVKDELPGVVCAYHLALIRPFSDRTSGTYLARLIASIPGAYQFKVGANGVTRFGLAQKILRDALFPLPPLDEQRAIADYLDRETGVIDALIAKTQQLNALLREKRVSLISHAVTKGLDPAAPLKDSGVEWLGEIPAHWQCFMLRRIVEKFVDYRGNTPTKVDYGIPLVTAKNVRDGHIDMELSREFIPSDLYSNWMVRGLPDFGDVVVTTEAPLGNVAQVEDTSIALAQRLILLKARKLVITNDYLKYYILSTAGQGELQSRATGSTAVGIKASRLKQIYVIVPPLAEQRAIADHLDFQTAKIDALVAKNDQLIALLREKTDVAHLCRRHRQN